MKDVFTADDIEALQRLKARRKYRAALQSGKLVRGPCAECGSTVGIHGHHENLIEKPLEVTWLCAPCHKKRPRTGAMDETRVVAVRVEMDWYCAMLKMTDEHTSMSDLAREAIKRFLRTNGYLREG